MIIKADNNSIIEVLKPFRVFESDVMANNNKIDGYKAICYEESRQPVCIVSNSYGLLQHDDIIKQTFSDLDKLNVNYEVKQVTMNNTNKRNTMATTITLTDMKINVDGSDIFGTIYTKNGTDGMTPFTYEFGFYRSICQNGMRVPQNLLISERLKHRKSLMMINIEQGINSVLEYMPTFGTILKRAQQIKLDQLDLSKMQAALGIAPRVFNNIVTGKYYDTYKEIVPEESNVDTLWGFYQVMTNYLTHVTANKSIRTEQLANERLYEYMLQAA